jgi:hypothetical protein
MTPSGSAHAGERPDRGRPRHTLIVATFLLRKVLAATPGGEHRALFAPIAGTTLIVGLVANAAPTDWFGLAQRAFVVVIVGWLGLQAAWLLAADVEGGRRPAPSPVR